MRDLAAKARSSAIESEVKARQLRGQASMGREFWYGLRDIAPGAPFTPKRQKSH